MISITGPVISPGSILWNPDAPRTFLRDLFSDDLCFADHLEQEDLQGLGLCCQKDTRCQDDLFADLIDHID